MFSQPLPDQVEVSIEVPRWGLIKRDRHGGIDFISPLPCPFNYGSVPGTLAADGDAQDALLVGPRAAAGSRVDAHVLGRVRFIDAGHEDAKWICGHAPLARFDRLQIAVFFRVYAQAKRALNALRGRPGHTRYAGLELR